MKFVHLKRRLHLYFKKLPEWEWLLLVNFFGNIVNCSFMIVLYKALIIVNNGQGFHAGRNLQGISKNVAEQMHLVTNSGPSKPT